MKRPREHIITAGKGCGAQARNKNLPCPSLHNSAAASPALPQMHSSRRRCSHSWIVGLSNSSFHPAALPSPQGTGRNDTCAQPAYPACRREEVGWRRKPHGLSLVERRKGVCACVRGEGGRWRAHAHSPPFKVTAAVGREGGGREMCGARMCTGEPGACRSGRTQEWDSTVCELRGRGRGVAMRLAGCCSAHPLLVLWGCVREGERRGCCVRGCLSPDLREGGRAGRGGAGRGGG